MVGDQSVVQHGCLQCSDLCVLKTTLPQEVHAQCLSSGTQFLGENEKHNILFFSSWIRVHPSPFILASD